MQERLQAGRKDYRCQNSEPLQHQSEFVCRRGVIHRRRSDLLYRIRVSKDTLTFIDFCLYLENLTRIDFRIGYLENLQNASLVFFILIMLSLFGQHNEPSYFHNPIAF